LGNTCAQRFIYVMRGAVTLEGKGKRHDLSTRGYAYLPEDFLTSRCQRKEPGCGLLKKSYERVDKIEPPRLIVSSEDAISSHALDGDSDLQVKVPAARPGAI